jgi:NAD(P)H-hydrate epimerase
MDIGIPQSAIDKQSINVNWVEEKDIAAMFKKRAVNTHKGTYGHVLVIAGSRGKCGAAGLAAIAGLRIGAGLVTIAAPKSCLLALEFNPLEAMTIALPETKNGAIDASAKTLLLAQMQGKTAVAIGPGISTEPETVQLIRELLPALACPLVIDADALNCLAQCDGLLSQLKAPAILTPHPKEMSRISGLSVQEILDDRIGVASRFAAKNSVGLILKGAGSVLAFPDGSVYINPTGNPGMATGGSGDVLTGMIAGLLAQGFDIKSAALAGAYIHGLAGDIYARENSETNLIAGDLLRSLPASLKRILP